MNKELVKEVVGVVVIVCVVGLFLVDLAQKPISFRLILGDISFLAVAALYFFPRRVWEIAQMAGYIGFVSWILYLIH